MAIIKCPECGHQVSDRAESCPNCGVKIAGQVVTCPQCGEVYFNNLAECPRCNHQTQSSNTENTQATSQEPTTPQVHKPNKKKRNIIIAIATIVVIIAAISLFSYIGGNKDEQKAYEYAMSSSDLHVLQGYLDTYKDAPIAHLDSIRQHLQQMQQGDLEWTNAVMSGSRIELENYLGRHPDTSHKIEIIHKMDSIDWAQAVSAKTLDGYNLYLRDNPNGEHIDDANDAIKTLKTNTVLPEEKEAISSIFANFFQSINTRDTDGLTSNVNSILTSFLGKSNATKSDVVTFMDKIYKDDITKMDWNVNDDYKISKKEIGDDEYQYTVQFSVNEQIERTDPTKEKEAKYQINAQVDPDGKITSFNMIKILE